MTEPTAYDFIQDTRLDALEGVLADVTVPGDGEVSFPVAQQGMDTTMWQQLFRAFGTGVLDRGGWPFRITTADSPGSGTVTVHPENNGPAESVFSGYFHRLPAPKTFTVPAVTTATSMYIALQYDPTGHKRPAGPITLGLFTGTLDRSQGKQYLLLWRGTRQPSTVVSQMVWEERRQRITPRIYVGKAEFLPLEVDGTLWGTRAETGDTKEVYEFYGSTGSMQWRNLSRPEWKKVGLPGSMREVLPMEWRVVNGAIELRGYCSPTSGDFPTTGTTTIGWIEGVQLPDVNIPIACNFGRLGTLAARVGSGGVRDNLVVNTPQSGTNRASLDNIRLPLG